MTTVGKIISAADIKSDANPVMESSVLTVSNIMI